MTLVVEIENLRDVRRGVQNLLDRINTMLEYQNHPSEYFLCNENRHPDCYLMSPGEKSWWTDLNEVLVSQRKCIDARLAVLIREPNYAKIQEDLAEWQRDADALNRQIGKARDNFDRDAYVAARTELKRLARFRHNHRKALYKLESPPGRCEFHWLFDEPEATSTPIPRGDELDQLAESFATALSTQDNQDDGEDGGDDGEKAEWETRNGEPQAPT